MEKEENGCEDKRARGSEPPASLASTSSSLIDVQTKIPILLYRGAPFFPTPTKCDRSDMSRGIPRSMICGTKWCYLNLAVMDLPRDDLYVLKVFNIDPKWTVDFTYSA